MNFAFVHAQESADIDWARPPNVDTYNTASMALLIVVGLIMLATVAFVIFTWVFWIIMLVDAINRKDWDHENDKLTWLLIMVLTGIIGSVIYYFMVKRKYRNKHK